MEQTSVKWRFRHLSPREESADPTEAEFFRDEGLADAIVREGIQNSMDARNDESKPVRVRVTIHDEKADGLSAEAKARYIDTLRPHLDAEDLTLPGVPDADESMRFITIEDFNTHGLRGDPAMYDDLNHSGDRNDFFYFWRNRGRSSKDSTDRGRWGVGKLVFSSASRIRSFWGLTRRSDDMKELLMGLSILQVHHVSGEEDRSAPGGRFGYPHENDLTMPLNQEQHQSWIDQFKRDFSLARTSEPGLSVVIPYPFLKDLDLNSISRSAILHYFYPILSGDLVVEVLNAEGTEHRIDAETVRDVTEDLEWEQSSKSAEDMKRLFDFSKWTFDVDKDDYVEIDVAGDGKAPTWKEDLFNGHLEELRDRFEEGQRIAIRAPIVVKPKESGNVRSHFNIYLVRDPELETSEEHYIRQGLTIPGIRQARRRGVLGILRVEDPALSSLVGDAENPAHTKWSEREDRLKRNFNNGAYTLRYVKNGIRKAIEYLTRPPEGENVDLLKDVFFLPDDGDGNSGNGGGGGQSDPDSEPDPPSPRSDAFQISSIPHGFRVTGARDLDLPEEAEIRVAYSTAKGNPFKRYSPIDFEISDVKFHKSVRGLDITQNEENMMLVTIKHQDFELEVTGFDELRDLAVDARLIEVQSDVRESE